MPLVSKFLFGMKDAADCLSAVHMYASEADLKAVQKMYNIFRSWSWLFTKTLSKAITRNRWHCGSTIF